MNAPPVWDRKLRKDRKICQGGTHTETETERKIKSGSSREWVMTALAQSFPALLSTKHQKALFIRRIKDFFLTSSSYNQSESLSDESDYSSSPRLRWPSTPTRCSWQTPWCSGGAVENTVSTFKWSTAPCSSCRLAPTGTSTTLLLPRSQLGSVHTHITASSSRGHVLEDARYQSLNEFLV